MTEWLNYNAHRSYPFKDDLVLTCVGPVPANPDNTFVLSNSMLLDFQIVTYTADIDYVRLASIVNNGGHSLSFNFQGLLYNDPTAYVAFAVTLAVTAYDSVAETPLVISGQSSDYSYTVTFGAGLYRCTSPSYPFYNIGTYTLTGATLVEGVVINMTSAVVSTITGTAAGSVPISASDIAIEGGYNSEVSISPSTNTITISVSPGAGPGQDCIESTSVCSGAVIQLNKVDPDAAGNINISGGNFMGVRNRPEINEVCLVSGLEDISPACGSLIPPDVGNPPPGVVVGRSITVIESYTRAVAGNSLKDMSEAWANAGWVENSVPKPPGITADFDVGTAGPENRHIEVRDRARFRITGYSANAKAYLIPMGDMHTWKDIDGTGVTTPAPLEVQLASDGNGGYVTPILCGAETEPMAAAGISGKYPEAYFYGWAALEVVDPDCCEETP